MYLVKIKLVCQFIKHNVTSFVSKGQCKHLWKKIVVLLRNDLFKGYFVYLMYYDVQNTILGSQGTQTTHRNSISMSFSATLLTGHPDFVVLSTYYPLRGKPTNKEVYRQFKFHIFLTSRIRVLCHYYFLYYETTIQFHSI